MIAYILISTFSILKIQIYKYSKRTNQNIVLIYLQGMFYGIQICSFFTTEQKRCVQSWFWIHQKSMTKTKNRSRIMTWFNPAFNKVVSANVATSFLWLIGRYFPKSHRLHKIFNRDTGRLITAVYKICLKYTKCILVRLHPHRVTNWHYVTVG